MKLFLNRHRRTSATVCSGCVEQSRSISRSIRPCTSTIASPFGIRLVLRKTLQTIRVGLYKIQVLLLCTYRQGLHKSSLCTDQVVLQKDAEVTFKSRYILEQQVPVGFGDQQHFSIFQRINIVFRRFVGKETIKVGDPPSLRGKLQNMFNTFFIYGVGA